MYTSEEIYTANAFFETILAFPYVKVLVNESVKKRLFVKIDC